MRSALLLLTLAVLLAGCAGTPPEHLVPANMPELKAALGVIPEHAAPIAKAQANATLARLGEPVRFTSEGSSDPQGLPLTYAWSFGDGGAAEGASVEHVFLAAGEFPARLTVTNAAGLADQDVIPVKVAPADLPPLAAFRVDPASGIESGKHVTFDAAGSRDPEGKPLEYDWDLGDGTTSHEATVRHAYAEPGVYLARLTVRDATGAASTTESAIRVAGAFEKAGTFTVTDAATTAMDVPVRTGLAALDATLTFDASLGANDLTLVLLDADDAEVARAETPTPPASQGAQTRAIRLDAAALDGLAAGTWKAQIVRESGSPAGVPWSLVVRVAY